MSGDPGGALADWRRALELDRGSIGPLYSRAFLLEREGRREEAAATWEAIVAWNEARGYDLLRWRDRNLFFGGAAGVELLDDGTLAAAGDPRRGGHGVVVA